MVKQPPARARTELKQNRATRRLVAKADAAVRRCREPLNQPQHYAYWGAPEEVRGPAPEQRPLLRRARRLRSRQHRACAARLARAAPERPSKGPGQGPACRAVWRPAGRRGSRPPRSPGGRPARRPHHQALQHQLYIRPSHEVLSGQCAASARVEALRHGLAAPRHTAACGGEHPSLHHDHVSASLVATRACPDTAMQAEAGLLRTTGSVRAQLSIRQPMQRPPRRRRPRPAPRKRVGARRCARPPFACPASRYGQQPPGATNTRSPPQGPHTSRL
jgi:hypothetical protein